MKTKEISFEMPLDAFSTLKTSPEEFTKDMRLAAAVKWFEMGRISQEKAAEIAGLSREDFLMALGQFNVSPFQYSAEEILEESGYA